MGQMICYPYPVTGTRYLMRGGIKMDTVKRVEQLAEERRLSVSELAKRCGVNKSTLFSSKSRNGQLSVDTIELICNGIGISLSEFFKN